MMEYNTCRICGACDGRAGMLFGNDELSYVHACQNCHDTRVTGNVTIHANLMRTPAEIKKTMEILTSKIKLK